MKEETGKQKETNRHERREERPAGPPPRARAPAQPSSSPAPNVTASKPLSQQPQSTALDCTSSGFPYTVVPDLDLQEDRPYT